MNEGGFGMAEEWTLDYTFYTHPVNDSEYFQEDFKSAEPVEIEGVFVTIGEFQDVIDAEDDPDERGYVPDEKELYELLDEEQRKMSREHGCVWSVQVKGGDFNFTTPIGSDEEDELMHRKPRITSIADGVTFVQKLVIT